MNGAAILPLPNWTHVYRSRQEMRTLGQSYMQPRPRTIKIRPDIVLVEFDDFWGLLDLSKVGD